MHANNNVQEIYSLSMDMLVCPRFHFDFDDVFIEEMSETFFDQ